MSWKIEYPKGKKPKPNRIKVFGGFVRMRRETLGLKQKEISRALGYKDPAALSSIELGKIGFPLKKLQKLADLISVNLFQLKSIYDLDLEMRARKEEREAFA